MTDFEMGRLISSAGHVTVPGTFRERTKAEREFIPLMDEAQKCLNCPKSKCTNCLHGTLPAKREMRIAAIRRCIAQNLSVAETCRRVGISRMTFYRIEKKMATA